MTPISAAKIPQKYPSVMLAINTRVRMYRSATLAEFCETLKYRNESAVARSSNNKVMQASENLPADGYFA